MNLWGKGTGLFFLSALFVFTACKDDLNKIGSQADQDKFEVHYKEFTIPSSTLLIDSVRTDNAPTLLVGGYVDDLFGTITTTPFVAFAPSTSSTLLAINTTQEIVNNQTIVHEVILDRAVFETRLDRYHYGYNGQAEDNISLSLHKLNTSIVSDEYNFNTTTYDYDPTPLAQLDLSYNTAKLDTITSDSVANATFVFSTELPSSYLLEMDQAIEAITLKDSDGYDSTLIQNISEYIFGFALKSSGGRDVIGLSPANTSMWLYYHHIDAAGEENPDSLRFTFGVPDNFNNISSDRTGTPIAAIDAFDKPFELDGTRYIQAGTGLKAYIEFNEVLTFLSERQNVIVNSTELVFENVITDASKTPPSGFNFFNVSSDFNRSSLTISGEFINTLYTDLGETYSLPYDSTNNSFQAIPRRYLQDLYDNGITTSQLVINPSNDGYTLNRFAISGDNIKLKMYYSVPTN